MKYNHQPVLLNECIDYLNIKKDGIYIDGTLGRGGHSSAIHEKLNNKGKLISIDRDKKAIKEVRKNFKNKKNIKMIHDNFINIPKILDELDIKEVDGMLFDLGFSSPQIDNPKRGFSYQKEGPLDMRMNLDQNLSAKDIINKYSKEELEEILINYGEENWAARIAEFIVEERKKKAIETTTELVEIIKAAIPKAVRRKGGHPARRTFQALRIETNNELKQLEEMIKKVVFNLKPGGRICIISFHSLEDRIVKNSFKYLNKKCICPPDFPICACDKKREVNIITKSPIRATEKEVEENRRARSAKLRVAERVKN
ncbi:MAG TPA: 16S rRNA (cytosine(1402)-N(4))-methyltransferase RsmH [Halanaerobiales bacterium]|nr:16S rRNA (cytosine(1402)-N(4))-methyltransferase RsmH [Halanaerobiales bacterium]